MLRQSAGQLSTVLVLANKAGNPSDRNTLTDRANRYWSRGLISHVRPTPVRVEMPAQDASSETRNSGSTINNASRTAPAAQSVMGVEKIHPAHWLKDHRRALPSIVAVLVVIVFWVVGAIGGIGFLADASSPMAILTGLYVGLAAVAVSIIVTLALNDLARRFSRTRR